MRIAFFSILLFAASLIGCQSGKCPEGFSLSRIGTDEAKSLIDTAAQLQIVDVRTPEEYQDGYIANSRLANIHDKNFDEKLKDLDRCKPTLVYCRSGNRSVAASKKMQEMGFKQLYDMDGGFVRWSQEGKPSVK